MSLTGARSKAAKKRRFTENLKKAIEARRQQKANFIEDMVIRWSKGSISDTLQKKRFLLLFSYNPESTPT